DRLIGALGAPAPSPSPPARPSEEEADPLTERELEISRLISEGAANRDIARTLFITEGTVRNHVTNALRKLDLRDRTQLALWYARTRGCATRHRALPGNEHALRTCAPDDERTHHRHHEHRHVQPPPPSGLHRHPTEVPKTDGDTDHHHTG